MWRSGALQRRVAQGAFRGADVHTFCYTQLRQLLLAITITELSALKSITHRQMKKSQIADPYQTVQIESSALWLDPYGLSPLRSIDLLRNLDMP
jgi:hypothetical protein